MRKKLLCLVFGVDMPADAVALLFSALRRRTHLAVLSGMIQ